MRLKRVYDNIPYVEYHRYDSEPEAYTHVICHGTWFVDFATHWLKKKIYNNNNQADSLWIHDK